MRVATWNFERGGRSRATAELQLRLIEDIDADVIVVTEPPAPLLARRGVVAAPQQRVGRSGPEAWVAIVGHDIRPYDATIPYQHMAVAAAWDLGDTPAVVYGSVLPWRSASRHAPDLALPGETAAGMFTRLLGLQMDYMRRVLDAVPDAVLIWAGDFNQSLEGPNATGSGAGRAQLESTLKSLGMTAWNRHEPHALDGLSAIDLICGPDHLEVVAVERLDPVVGAERVSDHAGYIVELREM